jgi:hypothetical protein
MRIGIMILHFGINNGSRDARIVIIEISEFRTPLHRQNSGEKPWGRALCVARNFLTNAYIVATDIFPDRCIAPS